MMTPQEINTIMATEVMGWELNYFLARKPKAYFNAKDEFQSHYDKWNPFENIEHAFMCLRKWHKDHPRWSFSVTPRYCQLLNYESDDPFITSDMFPEEHEAQAICDCLIKAITI